MPEESYQKIYRKCKKTPCDMERAKLEYEAGKSAVNKLDPVDQEVIYRQINTLTAPNRIKNFGEKAAYQLLQRLGVFFKEKGVSSGRILK